MKELIAAVVASAFVLASASGFAAGTAKNPDLTKQERMEMRDRADRLTAERNAAPMAVKNTVDTKSTAKPTTKGKKHFHKSKKVSSAKRTHTHART